MDTLREILPGLFSFQQSGRYGGVMKTNPYVVVTDDLLVFIDPGYPLRESEVFYRQLVARFGRRPGWILLTHGHTDHYGMAGFLQDQYGLPAYIHEADADRVRKGVSLDVAHLMEDLIRHWRTLGMTEEEVAWTLAKVAAFNEIYHPLKDVRTFREGAVFEAGAYRFEVLHTPGHTTGSCCFLERTQRLLFTGDTLFPPGIRTPLPGALFGDRGERMDTYLRSLEALRRLEVNLVLSGHGEPFQNHRARIDEALAYYADLEQRVMETLRVHSPLTAVELARRLLPDVDDYVWFLLTGETCDVLDRLKGRTAVGAQSNGPHLLWHPIREP